MIERLTQRDQFQLLRSAGTNRRSGPLRARVIVAASDSDTPSPVHLGFTIGRSFGSAVERNRMRRRLRHSARAVAQEFPVGVTHVLMGADRAALSVPHPELVGHCRSLLAPASTSAGTQP